MVKEIIDKVIEKEFWQRVVVDTTFIDFDESVVDACKVNYCGKYNTNWSCPPNVGTLEENKKAICSYKNAYVYTTKHDIEDSFDIEGMGEARKVHTALTYRVIDELKKANADFNAFLAGTCEICKKCAYPNPCRFPDKMYHSVESQGINVVEFAKKSNINYINGANTVTYFSMFVYNI